MNMCVYVHRLTYMYTYLSMCVCIEIMFACLIIYGPEGMTSNIVLVSSPWDSWAIVEVLLVQSTFVSSLQLYCDKFIRTYESLSLSLALLHC